MAEQTVRALLGPVMDTSPSFSFSSSILFLSYLYTYEKLCPCIIAAAVHTQKSYTAGWLDPVTLRWPVSNLVAASAAVVC